jgi:hypothetical protein
MNSVTLQRLLYYNIPHILALHVLFELVKKMFESNKTKYVQIIL